MWPRSDALLLCRGAGLDRSGRIGSPSPIIPVWEACCNPTSIAFGLVGVSATAFTGAAFLLGDARRYRVPDLERYFRRRAVGAGIVTAVVALAALGA